MLLSGPREWRHVDFALLRFVGIVGHPPVVLGKRPKVSLKRVFRKGTGLSPVCDASSRSEGTA
jgi:hypothetical protein